MQVTIVKPPSLGSYRADNKVYCALGITGSSTHVPLLLRSA